MLVADGLMYTLERNKRLRRQHGTQGSPEPGKLYVCLSPCQTFSSPVMVVAAGVADVVQ
jgi:hypothetical protein